jgi:plasmid stabilization system protein ParE
MRLVLTRSAEQDLARGLRFYQDQQPELGTYFLDSLLADLDSLAIWGGVHAILIGNVRRMIARRFPFAIYYIVQSETVTIVAVLDCRRSPALVRRRLKPR